MEVLRLNPYFYNLANIWSRFVSFQDFISINLILFKNLHRRMWMVIKEIGILTNMIESMIVD